MSLGICLIVPLVMLCSECPVRDGMDSKMMMMLMSSVMAMVARVLDKGQGRNGEVEMFCLDIIQN